MIRDNRIDKLVSQVATEFNVSEKEIEDIVDAEGYFIRKTIQAIPYKEMSLEEYRNTKKNFNLPGLCKLYTSERGFININKLGE